MRLKKGDLVTGYEYRLLFHPHPHPRLRPHFRPHLSLHLHLHPSDYGIILETIDKKDAWEDFDRYTKDEQAQFQNCYVVHWQRLEKEFLIYENEI